MQNEINVEEQNGIIHIVDHGVQTKDVLIETGKAMKEALSDLRAKGLPVRILVDVRDMKGQTADSRKYVIELFNRLDFDKAAAFGASLFIKHLIRLLLLMANKQEKIQYFSDEAEARKWLVT